MRGIVGVTALVALLVGSGLPVGAAAAPGLVWGPCPATPGVVLDARQECATVRVPLDYGSAGGAEISLAVSRIRSATPQARRGVLLLVPGGPGGSGLARPSTHGLRLPQSVLDRYDIVGFDPRGVGHSTPVSCGLEPRDSHPTVLHPWPGPGGDVSANVDRARRIAEACIRNGGALIRHISTRNEARDIDRIRQALGETRLSYWGVSYGTYVGAVYATMFPERTDRTVLDSSSDPDPHRVARGWSANFGRGAEDRFPDFAAWAVANHPALGGTPEAVRDNYLRLGEALDRNPRPDLTGANLRAVMFNSLESDARFPQLAAFLQAAATGAPAPAIPLPPPAVFENLIAVQTATACNDVAWPGPEQDHAGAVARNRITYPLTDGMPVNIRPCAFWPHRPAEPATRIAATGPANILMIQNRRDPATPLVGALHMRLALLHRARIVIVDSGGHNAYVANGNPCGDNTVTTFLTTGIRPWHDRTC
ncbi:MAG TPA: alpha/beta hydrolase [Actinophytocola sp.]|uniref:alpha/beta hydrolase n=1 Tax=Actinophytocola sp. TaxID=1872138 RepID=UPI002DBD0C5C|nr:alpha/beta hydrolase [Actinophytocola sp.]HEU5474567.1 alpha/beta hydrolase [Actinophytocola sp.]